MDKKYTKEELLQLGVDIDEGITNCGGMEDFYFEIIDDFENDEKRAELAESFESKDMNLYSIAVHSIKGILRMIGASKIGELAEKLQFASEANDVDTVNQYHQELSDQVEWVIEAIRSTR